jgi:hypothetical protein
LKISLAKRRWNEIRAELRKRRRRRFSALKSSQHVSRHQAAGRTGPMTDHTEETDLDEIDEPSDDRDRDDDQVDRAPAPGNTPAPDEAPYDSGAITGGRLADDH